MAQRQPRPADGVVRFYNFLPGGDSFLGDVLRGLTQPQKTLPPPSTSTYSHASTANSTEISCKYRVAEFQSTVRRAGFKPGQIWIDAANRFSVHGMIAG